MARKRKARPKRKYLVGMALVAVVVSSWGCAVQRSKAPQIDPKTANALNVGENLRQLNADYVQFFTDVGKARAAGLFTQPQVEDLNVLGRKMKSALDSANTVFRQYSASYDETLLDQINGYLTTAAQLYAQLVATRTQALVTKKGGV